MNASVTRGGAVLSTGALCSAVVATLAAVALVWQTDSSPQGTAVRWGAADHPWTAGVGLAAVLALLVARIWRRRPLAVVGMALTLVAASTVAGAFGDEVVGPAPWLAIAGYVVAAVLAGLDARELG